MDNKYIFTNFTHPINIKVQQMKSKVLEVKQTSASGVSTSRDAKMKVTTVSNYREGIKQLGVRASGVYKGKPIERTIWIPEENIKLFGVEMLIDAVKAEYRKEQRCIDELQ